MHPLRTIDPFHHPGLSAPGHCRLDLVETDERTVVIVTGAPDSPGGRLTDTVELVADQVCRQGLASPERLLFIQCDPGRTAAPAEDPEFGRTKPARYELVVFRREDGRFVRPLWSPLSAADVEHLIGQPPPHA
jgi:hypothetical protein